MLLDEACREYQEMLGDVPASVVGIDPPQWWKPAACPERNGWMLVRISARAPRIGEGICTITNPNGTPRLFKDLEAVIDALGDIGQSRFEVDLLPTLRSE